MLENLRRDVERQREHLGRPWPWFLLEALAFDNGFQAVLLYRMAHAVRRRGIPVLGPLLARIGLFLTGADISPAARIGPGLRIAHGVGIVIGGGARIGADALLLQSVTIGARSPHSIDRMPELGDRVFVGAGAAILGPVRIGSDVFIGAGTIVTEDVPDGSKVTCRTALDIVRRDPSRNGTEPT